MGGDGQRVAAGAGRARQHHQHTLPVGARHLGHVAVEQAVPVVHHDVLQVIRDQHAALAGVGAARLLQQLPPALVGSLHRRLHLPGQRFRVKVICHIILIFIYYGTG